MEAQAQVKVTDIIRRNLFDYIYSDDSLEDSLYIKEILNHLDDIDLRFERCDENERSMRRRIVEKDIEIRKLERKIAEMQVPTISEEGV